MRDRVAGDTEAEGSDISVSVRFQNGALNH